VLDIYRNHGISVYITVMCNGILYIYLLLLHVSAIEVSFRQLVHSVLLTTNMYIGQCLDVNSC
jgi:hypothetical protein